MSSIHVPTSLTPQNESWRGHPLHQSINPRPSFVDRWTGQPNSSKLSPTKSRQPRTGGDRPSYATPRFSILVGSRRGHVPAAISSWQLLAQFRRNDGLQSDFTWIYIGRSFPLPPSALFGSPLLLSFLSPRFMVKTPTHK